MNGLNDRLSQPMKTPLSVDEYDLAGFFGCLPAQLDGDEPWQHNDSAYEVADSNVHLSRLLRLTGT